MGGMESLDLLSPATTDVGKVKTAENPVHSQRDLSRTFSGFGRERAGFARGGQIKHF